MIIDLRGDSDDESNIDNTWFNYNNKVDKCDGVDWLNSNCQWWLMICEVVNVIGRVVISSCSNSVPNNLRSKIIRFIFFLYFTANE